MKLRTLLIVMSLTISLIPLGIIGGFQGLNIATVSLGLILAVIFIVSFIMAYLITVPILKLMKNIDEISRGNLDVRLEKSEIYEINNLIKSLNRVMISLKLAIRKVGIIKEDIFEETMKEKNTAESRYTSLLKLVDGWIWEVDNNGLLLFSSDKIFDSLGYQPSEIVGKNIINFIESKDKQRLKKMLINHTTKAAGNQKYPITIELNFNHKGGDNVSFLSSMVPFYDESYDFLGFRGMNRKITDIYQKKVDLNEKITDPKNEKLKIINKKDKFNNLTNKSVLVNSIEKNEFDYRFLLDKDTNIVECSADMAEKLGYDKSEILSLTLNDLDCFEEKENIKNKLNNIKDLGNMNFKTMYRKKDKRTILVNETIRYLKKRNLFECSVKEELGPKEI